MIFNQLDVGTMVRRVAHSKSLRKNKSMSLRKNPAKE